jgi:DNA-binding NtrC family response regulator
VLERAAVQGDAPAPHGWAAEGRAERLAAVPPVIAPDPSDPGMAALDVVIDPAVPLELGKALLVGQYERSYVQALMHVHDGNVARAARAAEIDPAYLLRLLDDLGLRSTQRA